MSDSLLRRPNFGALVILVWLVVASALLWNFWGQTGRTLLDTDDATRLVQLRDWLGGQGWFDLHQSRMQPPEGYDTHWSRLIDAGLAGLLFLFGLFTDAATAERLMRACWPVIWLLPTIVAMTTIAWRIAGREGATVALLLAMAGVPAYQQFTPGRIDHHNVQIALTLFTAAATVWSDRVRWAAAAAGVLSGVALAIGFESVPYLAACGGMLALRHVVDRDSAPQLVSYGGWLAASSIGGFFATIGPQHWLRHSCDSIAVNTLPAVVAGGAILAVAAALNPASRIMRALAIAVAAGAAVVVLLLIEPACARGPFGMIDPAIRPIWLDGVREMQPLFGVLQLNPLTGIAIATFPAMSLLAAAVMLRSPAARCDFGSLAAVAVFLVGLAVTVGAIRGFSYAMWLGMPLVATMALRLFDVLRLQHLWSRMIVALLLTPMVLTSAAITIGNVSGLTDREPWNQPLSEHCSDTASFATLAPLPPGIVAADVSFGPYIMALTPHSVLAGPYHHLSRGIVVAHRILAEPPEESRKLLEQNHVTYVALCGSWSPRGLAEPERSQSLWGRLRAGAVPDWLEQVRDVAQPFTMYRVRRQSP